MAKEVRAKAQARERKNKENQAKIKAKERAKKAELAKKAEKRQKVRVERSTKAEKALKKKVAERKSKEKEKKAREAEREKKRLEAKAREQKKKREMKAKVRKEKTDKKRAEKKAKAIFAEKKRKEKQAKAVMRERKKKAEERNRKAKERSAKAAEKKTKRIAAEKKAKERHKKEKWAKQVAAEKNTKRRKAQEKKAKAACAARARQEKRTVRFTLAQEQKVSTDKRWMNFGHGYQGLRLQKQGNLCVLSGFIRVARNTIYAGQDRNKKFWHSMESLLQLDAAAGVEAREGGGGWGNLAKVPASCRPSATVAFTVNNHALPAKIAIKSSGHVSFQSGGTKSGIISVSGVVYKAAGKLSSKGRGISKTQMGGLIFANGWRGTGTNAYRQGAVCTLSGKITGGRNWKSRILTLPKWCRPKATLRFALSQNKRTVRLDVTPSGAVIPVSVSNAVRNRLNLNTITFSTRPGKVLKLYSKRGWRTAKKTAAPRAFRMGSLCVLEGSAYNSKVKGSKNTLKNSAAIGKLPEWCRPEKRLIFSTVSPNGQLMRVDVLQNGEVRWEGGKRDKHVSISGIKFNVPTKTVQKYSKNMLKVTKCRL